MMMGQKLENIFDVLVVKISVYHLSAETNERCQEQKNWKCRAKLKFSEIGKRVAQCHLLGSCSSISLICKIWLWTVSVAVEGHG